MQRATRSACELSSPEVGSSKKRKLGYKEYLIHQLTDHQGLEQLFEASDDPKLREMAPLLVKK